MYRWIWTIISHTGLEIWQRQVLSGLQTGIQWNKFVPIYFTRNGDDHDNDSNPMHQTSHNTSSQRSTIRNVRNIPRNNILSSEDYSERAHKMSNNFIRHIFRTNNTRSSENTIWIIYSQYTPIFSHQFQYDGKNTLASFTSSIRMLRVQIFWLSLSAASMA